MATDTLRDRMDGLVNPFLIKDMYQSLHSRRFLSALWLLLASAMLAFILIFVGRDGRNCGNSMFIVFNVILSLTACCVVPLLAFLGLTDEVRSRTVELVQITRIDSRRQVRGRLMAAFTRIALLFALIGPFAVGSFLFRDVDVAYILGTMHVTLLEALFLCTLAILFAALTSIRELRTLAWLGVLVFLILAFLGSFDPEWKDELFLNARRGAIRELDEALLALSLWTVGVGLAIWFCSAAAANMLTFPADKCSGKTKFILIIYLLLWFATHTLPMLLGYAPRVDDEQVPIFVFGACVPLAVFGLFWITGLDRIAARVRRKLQSRGPAYGLLVFPFVDGLASTAVYLLLFLILVLIGGYTLGTMAGSSLSEREAFRFLYYPVLAFGVYMFYLSALARGAARLLPGKGRTVKSLRGALLGLVALDLLITVFWAVATSGEMPDPSAVTGLFPIFHYACVVNADSHPSLGSLAHLILPVVVGLAFHVHAIGSRFQKYAAGAWGGVREPVKRRTT